MVGSQMVIGRSGFEISLPQCVHFQWIHPPDRFQQVRCEPWSPWAHCSSWIILAFSMRSRKSLANVSPSMCSSALQSESISINAPFVLSEGVTTFSETVNAIQARIVPAHSRGNIRALFFRENTQCGSDRCKWSLRNSQREPFDLRNICHDSPWNIRL